MPTKNGDLLRRDYWDMIVSAAWWEDSHTPYPAIVQSTPLSPFLPYVPLLSCFPVEETSFGDSVEGELGPTFGVAVTAVILATVFSVLLLLFARFTGNGPLYECCHSLMLANKANGNRSPAAGEPVPVPKPYPTATATAATAPDYEEAGAPPTATGSAADEQQHQQSAPPPPPYDELPPAADV